MSKKKKMKEELFTKDYSKITPEKQQELNEMVSKIMNGECDDIDSSDITTKLTPNDNGPIKITVIKDRHNENNTGFESFLANSLNLRQVTEDSLVEDLVESLEDNDSSEGTEDIIDGLRPVFISNTIATIPNPIPTTDERIDRESDVTSVNSSINSHMMSKIIDEENEENNFSDEYNNEGEENLSPLQSSFKLVICDEDNGDFIISDPYKHYKSHTINTYNLIEARTNYASSSVYNGMVKNIPLALAFISGPILVVTPGNELFQKFITTVEEYDRDHIFILSRTEETKDSNGTDVIDFLVYYADPESVSFTKDLIKDFQGESNASIDFLYSIFKKAMDRHENIWSNLEWIDNVIEIEKSQPEDVEFVMNLITNEESTIINTNMNRTVQEFMKEFTRPIDNYIDPERGIFTKNCKMLKALLDDKLTQIDKEGVLVIPENFGSSKSPKNQSYTHLQKNTTSSGNNNTVYSSGSLPNRPFADAFRNIGNIPKDNVETDNVEIDDVEDLSEVSMEEETQNNVQNEEVKVNPAQEVAMEQTEQPKNNTGSNMKRFGSNSGRPGSMVVRVN